MLYYKKFKRKLTLGNRWKMRAVMLVLQQQRLSAACQMHLAVSLFPSASCFHNVLKYILWQEFKCSVVCWMIQHSWFSLFLEWKFSRLYWSQELPVFQKHPQLYLPLLYVWALLTKNLNSSNRRLLVSVFVEFCYL